MLACNSREVDAAHLSGDTALHIAALGGRAARFLEYIAIDAIPRDA